MGWEHFSKMNLTSSDRTFARWMMPESVASCSMPRHQVLETMLISCGHRTALRRSCIRQSAPRPSRLMDETCEVTQECVDSIEGSSLVLLDLIFRIVRIGYGREQLFQFLR